MNFNQVKVDAVHMDGASSLSYATRGIRRLLQHSKLNYERRRKKMQLLSKKGNSDLKEVVDKVIQN